MLEHEIAELLPYLSPEETARLDSLLSSGLALWEPLPGPQSLAFNSTADEIGYGGSAGGGKTSLALGMALAKHKVSAIFRKNGTEHTAIMDSLTSLLGGRDAYNGKENTWRVDGRQIELCSTPNNGDETKYQGRPHDLLVFDEATNFPLSTIRYLTTWLRSVEGLPCQMLLTFNPPTTAEGRWVVDYFAPWLDAKHPNPADPGELRCFAVIEGKDVEVPDLRKFVVVNGKRVYDFDQRAFRPEDIVTPVTRTFIPARITDNPYLANSGYMRVLQALPEPLRSQMLYGDFTAGMQDDPWQVVPTAWVEDAMARWKKREPKPPMESLGVDVARGGNDQTVIARRHGRWYDTLLTYPGSQTPNGPAVAGLAIAALRDRAPIHIDVIGVGSSPYDFLQQSNQQVLGINVAEASARTDQSGRLTFYNLRSDLWWRMREMLDPANNLAIELPPDRELLADLCAPRWELRGTSIKVESRDDIVARIGRSPDKASAVILASIDTPRRRDVLDAAGRAAGYDPFRQAARGHDASRNGYDPFASPNIRR